MKYGDYVDLKYSPKNDLICDFFVEPLGISLKKAAGAVAAESSIGTWTETTTTKKYVERLAANVFEIKGNNLKIAYPSELFEPGNMPNILSSVAGNVFGMKDLKNLRLNDIQIPENLLKSFKGPKFGIKGIRKILKVPKRPLLGTIVKPKLGLKTEDHAKVAYDAWIGGCDIVKDDENLSSQSFNRFEARLEKTFKAKERAERETGEKKVYMINITAECEEMIRRAELVEDCGNEYVMVDILTAGWSALQNLRNKNFNLVLHAHRAGHAAFTKNPRHGISMKVIAKVSRIIGIDQLHVGTAVGKMHETKEDVLENCEALKEKMGGLKPVMPVASGGLHAGHVPELVKIFGNDFVIQAGGGIHALGTRTGARAMRQALDATMKKIPLKEYSKTHRELRAALERFD
jgi:ribulose-bisphosphate carboxylase large chain